MIRKPSTFEERKARIWQIAATCYPTPANVAMEYLVTLEGAKIEDQIALFALILGWHNARLTKVKEKPLPNTIPAKEYRAIAERLREVVRSWTARALQNNASLEETAKTLWDDLTLYEGKDRVVALALLLNSKAVPYAQLPKDFLVVKSMDIYEEAYKDLLSQFALFHRAMISAGGLSAVQPALALAKILETIPNQDSRVALLNRILGVFFEVLHQVKRVEIFMEHLGQFFADLADRSDEE